MIPSPTTGVLAIILLFVSDFAASSHSHGQQGRTIDVWPPSTNEWQLQCDIGSDSQRFDCHPEQNASPETCSRRGCCWKPASHPGPHVPWCFYPSSYTGYKVTGIHRTPERINIELLRQTPSDIDVDVQSVSVSVVFYGPDVARVMILDPSHERYTPPVPFIPAKTYNGTTKYRVDVNTYGALSVHRLGGEETPVFQTNLSRLVFTDQFLQVPLLLPSNRIYGLGEHYASLMRPINWTSYYFFNRDREPIPNANLYGSHPLYICLEDGGTAHGVFLHNSNAMEVLLQPTPAATFRVLGGILDFFIFLGPSPAAVVRQYQNIVGRPAMPPYWGLGFHLCRFGYGSLNRTKEVLRNNVNAGVPVDVQWNDIDYMDHRNDFTYDPDRFAGLPQFVNELHSEGRHYVVITDPAVSGSEPPGSYPPFDEGVAMDIFVKNTTGGIVYAKVWNAVSSVFPDFSHPKAGAYWMKQLRRFSSQVDVDGIWLDMNEPSNFYNGHKDGCPPDSKLERPPYVPSNEPLCSKTLCMSDRHYVSEHYNVHNIYGFLEVLATYKALKKIRQKRPFIISRATSPGQGSWSGHWTGDVASTWEDMRASIPAILSFGMYGIPLVGADICGFNGNTTVELCARWQALGAYYPFSRNHNTDDAIDQDPYSLGPIVLTAAIANLKLRYVALPYLYTLFYRSHVFGDTVARAMFMEFPEDSTTYAMDTQFMWGSGLLIAPALYPNQTTVRAYLPAGVWYQLGAGQIVCPTGQYVDFPATLNSPPVWIPRGGVIVPMQQALPTTTQSRLTPLSLMVPIDERGNAKGELFIDDGDSLNTIEDGRYLLYEFNLVKDVITVTCTHRGYPSYPSLFQLLVLGVPNEPHNVTVAGKSRKFKYNTNGFLSITVEPPQEMNEDFTITWS
ncbi:lysosomal alpha-glucosidase-like [Ornithodoros turicata]|uniref:lysosomal alpha-glucosidase-like n=1 Tax=Ornithodoros turicata TaxID=34597 RepID=UPI0031391939